MKNFYNELELTVVCTTIRNLEPSIIIRSNLALDVIDVTSLKFNSRQTLAAKLERIWQRRTAASIALYPLSIIYCTVMAFRRLLYRINLFAHYRAPCPVIVVGNITVGGNGKTPFTMWLVEWLRSKGCIPGIVLRGYGGDSTVWPQKVDMKTSPSMVGDEAVLLAQRTGAVVVTGPDRGQACKRLLQEGSCDVIISDDGLQHLALKRDFEIALHDSTGGIGNGWCLPAGPLREPLSRLEDVDLIVEYGNPEHGITPLVSGFRSLASPEQSRMAVDFINRKILFVTGIARPERFMNTMTGLGINGTLRAFPDHHVYQPKDLDALGFDAILITEKDAVKLSEFTDKRIFVAILDLDVAPAIVLELERRLLPLIQHLPH